MHASNLLTRSRQAEPGVRAGLFATAEEIRFLKIVEICAGVTGAESAGAEIPVFARCGGGLGVKSLLWLGPRRPRDLDRERGLLRRARFERDLELLSDRERERCREFERRFLDDIAV